MKGPVVGARYTRQEIHAMFGGGVQDYLPHRDGLVTCGAFRRDTNPDAPDEILPGTGPEIELWARVLCDQKAAIPVFLKDRPGAWEYVGMYRVASWTEDPNVIAERARRTGRTDITRVIRLELVGTRAVNATAGHSSPAGTSRTLRPLTPERHAPAECSDRERLFSSQIEFLLGRDDAAMRHSVLPALSLGPAGPTALPDERLRSALYACLPKQGSVDREALIEAVAARLGELPVRKQLRSQLNKLLNAERNEGRLDTDWVAVWRA